MIRPCDIGIPDIDATIGPLMVSTRDAREDEFMATGAKSLL